MQGCEQLHWLPLVLIVCPVRDVYSVGFVYLHNDGFCRVNLRNAQHLDGGWLEAKDQPTLRRWYGIFKIIAEA